MGDYYRVPETPKRPGNVPGGGDDPRFQCSPMNPFGQPKSNPSIPQMRADDGTSRTEAQYLRDQMKLEQELGMAMSGPQIYTIGVVIGTGRIGIVLDIVDTLSRLRENNLTEVAIEQLMSKIIEVGTDKLVEKISVLKGSEDVIANVVEDAIQEGGGRLSESWRSRLEARQDKAWSKEQDDIQRAIDRAEHRKRLKPGDTMEA